MNVQHDSRFLQILVGMSKAISALSEHLVPAVNHILGHGVVAINFPQHGNDLGELFLERTALPLVLEMQLLKFQPVTKIRVQISSDADWVKAFSQLTRVLLPTLNHLLPFPLCANWLASAARAYSTFLWDKSCRISRTNSSFTSTQIIFLVEYYLWKKSFVMYFNHVTLFHT